MADFLATRTQLTEKWHDCVTVLLGTAMRYGSIAQLELASIDATRKVVQAARPKGKRAVEVPVSDEVLAASIRCVGHELPDDEAQQLGRRIRSACKRAEVPQWTAHDLRVTAATAMSRAGVALRDLQDLLGHASLRTTEKYVRSGGQMARGPI